MLSLTPPFLEYDGVVVAPDYTNPRQFWYFPNRPQIAVDENGRPVVRMLVYRENLDEIGPGDEDATGFFFFDTVLSWPEETIREVARKIKDDLSLDDDPILSPLLYRSGTSRCTFLDRATGTGGPVPNAPAPPEDWVAAIDGPASPALYGENRATFLVKMTKKATALLYGSFDGFIPAGVVYELDYVAMQRAFAVHVDVEWAIAYQFIRDYEAQRFLFWSSEMENIVEKLEEKRIVQITSAIEGVDEEGMPSEFAEARKQLTSFIFEKFFAVVPNPKEAGEPGIGDQILSFLGGVRSIAMPFSFSCVKRTLDVDQLREFHADWTVDRAVVRTIAPQAHLAVFWQDFAPPLTRNDIVKVVGGDETLWQTVSIDVAANADFATDAIAVIAVDIAYGAFADGAPAADAKRYGVTLDAAHLRATIRDWYSPDVGTALHYRYQVAFGPDAVAGSDVVLTSPWIEGRAGPIVITPTELYHERRITFQRAKLLDPTLFPEVLVHVRYADPHTGWSYETSGLLEAGGPAWATVMRLRSGAPAEVEYRLEYAAANGPTVVDWRPTISDTVLVDDPRANLFPVTVVVGDRSVLGQIIVSLAYDDAEADIHLSTVMSISKDTVDQPHTWVFPRAKVGRDIYRYSQLVISSDGSVVQAPWVETRDAILVVGPKFARKWTVQVCLTGPEPAAAGVERVAVSLVYDDPHEAVHDEEELTFTATGQPQPWPLALADLQARTYQYTVRYHLASGFIRTVGPRAGSDTFLFLPSAPEGP